MCSTSKDYILASSIKPTIDAENSIAEYSDPIRVGRSDVARLTWTAAAVLQFLAKR